MDLTELAEAVDEAFARTGAGLRRWPDPRPDGRPPRDEEYSRCLDPGKYRLLLARADAWVIALTGLGLGQARDTAVPASWELRGRRPASRAVVVEPAAAGALALYVLQWEVDPDGFVAMVEVRVGPTGVVVVSAPDCGCDACDDGSDAQLRTLDEAVTSVLAGEWLHLEAPGAVVTATREGWSADGGRPARDIARLVEEAWAGCSPYPVLRAGRWW